MPTTSTKKSMRRIPRQYKPEDLSLEEWQIGLRSQDIGLNYCSCQDFRVSTLGTCEHIEFVWARLRHTRGLKKTIAAGHKPSYSSLSLRDRKSTRLNSSHMSISY